jgi:hypothetical protein
MYCRFQEFIHKDAKQHLAYGDKDNGTLYLWEIPNNLKNEQPRELENI